VLPWRGTTDPYRIFVSEVMLQQTQVDRVVGKYRQFVRAFPSWRSLARARLDRVLAVWRGLGYNRRALWLKRAAEAVAERHGGRLPRDVHELERLPGVGEATARSIAAFAFNEPTVFIETNIRSVFLHHFFPGRSKVGDCQLLPLVERTLDRRNPARWYSALMDYGVYLKRHHGNPSRRSRHHVRQAPFEGSDRQVRGRILTALLERPGQTRRGLQRNMAEARGRVPALLERLCAEGMVRRNGARYRVAT
jgi:A/G-specific adenine glycosylase